MSRYYNIIAILLFFFSKKTINKIATVSIENEYPVNEIHNFKELKNIFFIGRLVWQKGVISKTFDKISAVIFLGDMTVLSTWVAALIFRVRGVNVIFWGHGLYGNENKIKRKFRVFFLKIANYNLVYENRAKNLLAQQNYDVNKISVIYNSINYEEQKHFFEHLQSNPPNGIFNNHYPTLLFIGRLTKQKKIEQLIQSTILLKKQNFEINLLIIGDGPERNNLEKISESMIKEGQCLFYGETYSEKEISKLIYTSQLVVSPGNIGLTAIHALSYGTPVCSHSNYKNQMPEVEAIIDGENGFLFHEDDIQDLSKGIIHWFNNNSFIDRNKIRNIVDNYYNPNFQLEVIKRILDK